MAPPVGEQIEIDVETVAQIFNDSDADPFSEHESAILGEAALERVLTRLQAHPLRSWDGVQLIVRLPETQITPDLDSRLSAAIRRYCTARIEENRLQVSLSRKQHFFGMLAVTLLVLIVILIAYVLFTYLLPDAPVAAQALVAASISVFAWVILWDPLEALLFDWAPPAARNHALEHVMDMRITVQQRT